MGLSKVWRSMMKIVLFLLDKISIYSWKHSPPECVLLIVNDFWGHVSNLERIRQLEQFELRWWWFDDDDHHHHHVSHQKRPIRAQWSELQFTMPAGDPLLKQGILTLSTTNWHCVDDHHQSKYDNHHHPHDHDLLTVPTLPRTASPSGISTAKPRSEIRTCPLLSSRMFSGLQSLIKITIIIMIRMIMIIVWWVY